MLTDRLVLGDTVTLASDSGVIMSGDVVATGGDDGHGDWEPDCRVELTGFSEPPLGLGIPMGQEMQGPVGEPAVEYAMSFVLQSAAHRGNRAVFNPMSSGDVHQWEERMHGSHERAFISACQFLQEYFDARRNECSEWNREFSGEDTCGDAQGPFEAEY